MFGKGGQQDYFYGALTGTEGAAAHLPLVPPAARAVGVAQSSAFVLRFERDGVRLCRVLADGRIDPAFAGASIPWPAELARASGVEWPQVTVATERRHA